MLLAIFLILIIFMTYLAIMNFKYMIDKQALTELLLFQNEVINYSFSLNNMTFEEGMDSFLEFKTNQILNENKYEQIGGE